MNQDHRDNHIEPHEIASALRSTGGPLEPRQEFVDKLESQIMESITKESNTMEPKSRRVRSPYRGVIFGSVFGVCAMFLLVFGLTGPSLDFESGYAEPAGEYFDAMPAATMEPVGDEGFMGAAQQMIQGSPKSGLMNNIGGSAAMDIMIPHPSSRHSYPYHHESVLEDDMREIMETRYNARIRSKHPIEVANEVQIIIGSLDGRVDHIETANTHANIRFVVPQEHFSEFTTRMRALAPHRKYDETIVSSNLLREVRLIEEKIENAQTQSQKESLQDELERIDNRSSLVVGSLNISKYKRSYYGHPRMSPGEWLAVIALPLIGLALVIWTISLGVRLARANWKISGIQAQRRTGLDKASRILGWLLVGLVTVGIVFGILGSYLFAHGLSAVAVAASFLGVPVYIAWLVTLAIRVARAKRTLASLEQERSE